MTAATNKQGVPARDAVNDPPGLSGLHDLMWSVCGFAVGSILIGVALAGILILTKRRGTFALIPAPLGALVVLAGFELVGVTIIAGCVLGCGFRERWRLDEIKKGGDKARNERNSIGVVATMRNRRERRDVDHRRKEGRPWVEGRYPIGLDKRRQVVWAPFGGRDGRHTLIVGATRAGKTNTVMGTIKANLDHNYGLVVIDPKGDHDLPRKLRKMAEHEDRDFFHFSLDGASDAWNPLHNGTPSERADKLIGAEEWTEPHYKRLYQRYLLNVFTAMDFKADIPDLATVVNLLYPDRLALYVRELPEIEETERIALYVGSLTADETRDLAGLRNRLAILVEGEHRDLLSAFNTGKGFDLLSSISHGDVVVFSLNSSTSPETAKLLGAAIFQDLKHVAGVLERQPSMRWPCAVIVDEFGAFGSEHVLGLFQRAASARMSLTLISQELADLHAVAPAFRDQVVGNVETIIAHRQSTPESAELVAQLAGTTEVWIHTWQTEDTIRDGPTGTSGLGSKRRGHEFHIGVDTIKALQTGEAIVITKNPHQVRHVHVYDNTSTEGNARRAA